MRLRFFETKNVWGKTFAGNSKRGAWADSFAGDLTTRIIKPPSGQDGDGAPGGALSGALAYFPFLIFYFLKFPQICSKPYPKLAETVKQR